MRISHSSKPAALRLLLVEDHPVVQEGLKLLLQKEGIDVCRTATNSLEAGRILAKTPLNAVVLDLALGKDDGIALISQIRKAHPELPVLVYSMYEDAQHIERAFRAGANGYVTKRADVEFLIEGILQITKHDGRYMDPVAARAFATEKLAAPAQPVEQVLSDQELRIYRMIGQGDGSSEIGRKMHLSCKTVESYCQRIMVKLGVDGMKELRHRAIQQSHTSGAP